jgi:zinc D-Ala-D-Ala carboxypeptidase
MRSSKKQKLLYSLMPAAILVIVVILAWPAKNLSVANPTPRPDFDKNLYPTSQASSLWAVVNKGRGLPASYTPANLVTPNVPLRLVPSDPEMQLRSEAAAAIEKMFNASQLAGINLRLASGYRSYSEQQTVYENYAKYYGVKQADTFSARPGHSEHQTGLAADIEPASRNCELDNCFANTAEGRWLDSNCYKYGFIVRYQKNNQPLTGYVYEPWHIRYVGTDLSAVIQSSGQTLEQFFSLPAYQSYPSHGLTLTNV